MLKTQKCRDGRLHCIKTTRSCQQSVRYFTLSYQMNVRGTLWDEVKSRFAGIHNHFQAKVLCQVPGTKA
jgi:hypothetical protein